MKGKPFSRTTRVILLCWAIILAAILFLLWKNQQITFVGESAHWRATWAVEGPRGEVPWGEKRDVRFRLTWIGDPEDCKGYRNLNGTNSFGGGFNIHSDDLEANFIAGYEDLTTLSGYQINKGQVTVVITLSEGTRPDLVEEIVLTMR